MSKRDDLVEKYAKNIKEKFNEDPDEELLRKVVIGCGPAIYGRDAETVSAGSPTEIERVRKNFLIKKLGLDDDEKLDEAIKKVMDTYGSSNKTKFRAVLYYMLTKHFKKESVYK